MLGRSGPLHVRAERYSALPLRIVWLVHFATASAFAATAGGV